MLTTPAWQVLEFTDRLVEVPRVNRKQGDNKTERFSYYCPWLSIVKIPSHAKVSSTKVSTLLRASVGVAPRQNPNALTCPI